MWENFCIHNCEKGRNRLSVGQKDTAVHNCRTEKTVPEVLRGEDLRKERAAEQVKAWRLKATGRRGIIDC